MPRIVVGVDGSDHAERAVGAALQEARLRGADLDVVHVVPELLVFAGAFEGTVPMPSSDELRATGLEVIDEALSEVDLDDVAVQRIAAIGNSSQLLCETAQGADLLVVGSRGLGGFRGLLVGSVTQQLVAHSPCPVLVVVPEGR